MATRSIRRAAVAAALCLLPAALVSAGPASAGSSHGDHHSGHGPKLQRVGYFIQWGIYDRGFFPKHLEDSGNADRLTTINYAFGNVSESGHCFEVNQAGQGDAFADYQRLFAANESVTGVADSPTQRLAGSFNQLRQLKARHPQLRVLMSLGGFTWSKFFSNAALTPQSRRDFVASCIDLFIKGNLPQLDGSPQGGPGSAAGVFDGFDLDWEWPGSPLADGNIVRPEDKANFTLLLKEFRTQLDALGRKAHKRYLLTAFLPADPVRVDKGFEVPKIFRYLDWATVQGYDMHGTWESTTNQQSSLFVPRGDPSPEGFTADNAIQAYLTRHAPARKLVLGVPFYGRGWTGVPDTNNGLFQTSTGAAPARFEAGVEDYKTLKGLRDQGYDLFRNRRAGFAWLFNGTTFWTFDDPEVMAQKAAYVQRLRLGGIMAWSLDSDDAQGSLMRTIDRGLR